ncbi:MAG: DUF4381 domain-containing protein [Gammaproteobacteria bacterium]
MTTPNPLANLQDIVTPHGVDWWPLAPGWYFMGLVIVLLLIVAILRLYQQWSQKSAKRQALRELEHLTQRLTQRQISTQQLFAQLAMLLKRVALVYFPHSQVAGLQGSAWLAFLDRSGATQDFTRGKGQCFLTAPYQAHEVSTQQAQEAVLLAKRWIKRCRRRD